MSADLTIVFYRFTTEIDELWLATRPDPEFDEARQLTPWRGILIERTCSPFRVDFVTQET